MKQSKIVEYSSEEVKRLPDESNWAANAAMTDEEIDAAIASDPDEAGLGDEWMAPKGVPGTVTFRGKVVTKKRKVAQ